MSCDGKNQAGSDTSPGESGGDDAYLRGYAEAMSDVQRDLAMVLRCAAIGAGAEGETALTDAQARQVYAGVFGVMMCEREFGLEPTGKAEMRCVPLKIVGGC